MTQPVRTEWRLPNEMQARAQWCIAAPDKSPYLVGNEGPYRAKVNQGPWMDFQTALKYSVHYNCPIGYVLTKEDPFTCIDLDIKDALNAEQSLWTAREQLNIFKGLVQFANSYTELSHNRRGAHIWVYGNIGEGRRTKGIEIYSQERFIICTGAHISQLHYLTLNNIHLPITENKYLPVAPGKLILQNLLAQTVTNEKANELIELEPTETDAQVWSRAISANNADKFKGLCSGNWKAYGFPSQSEADLALMSMFTYYSQSNEQCRRMFRQTYLGQREKAVKNNVYLDYTLRIIRSRQAKEKKAQKHGEELSKQLLAAYQAKQQKPPENVEKRVSAYVQSLNQTKHSKSENNVVKFEKPTVEGLPWPPGLTGAIASFIYQSAPRPVKEVAIVAALGLMAGITGKAYNIGQTGLNLYIILVARSAIGKEAMHTGIGHILRAPCGHAVSPFVNFNDYVSGPALSKGVAGFPSFVNVSGEWGRRLQRMSDEKRDGPMQQLRTVMTNLYQKSGVASVVGGINHSDKDKDVESVSSVAYSMIGETTPGTFYDSLTNTMMEDGFLSRFNIIEYDGERPAENQNQLTVLPQEISDVLANIASHCVSIVTSKNPNAIQIELSSQAAIMLNEFNVQCDKSINQARTDEAIRQIWNRAHLKAIRVAGVLACADNHITPIIHPHHAEWAINVVMQDATSMLSKIKGGDVGIDDNSRFKKLQGLFRDYMSGNVPVSYGINPEMIKDGVIPKKYLQRRTNQIRCFINHRLGAATALDHTLKVSIDSGHIIELDKLKAIEKYNYHGRCFRLLDMEE